MPEPPPTAEHPLVVRGVLLAYFAFDWGEEIELARAQTLASGAPQPLARRQRTPASIAFRPPPLRVPLASVQLELAELGTVEAEAEAALFDFGVASLRFRVPFALPAERLLQLSASLARPEALLALAERALQPLYAAIRTAIVRPDPNPLSEEYFVFQVAPDDWPCAPDELLSERAAWLAQLVRLESADLCAPETAEALRLHLRYGPKDLIVVEWAAAFLLDDDCEQTLQTLEFANVQLLEFRLTDQRLDDQILAAYRLVDPAERSLARWRSHARRLRLLGKLKIDAHAVYERATGALKLVGDQYLARLYKLLVARLHLDEWSQSIERSLGVVEHVYRAVSDQAATARAETMELIIIGLILFEIVMALAGR